MSLQRILPAKPAMFVTLVTLALIASLAAIALAKSTESTVGADDSHLRNFRIPPSAEQQMSDLRAAGVDGPVSIPESTLPGPEVTARRYGPYQLIPDGWIGEVDESALVPNPSTLPTADSAVADITVLRASDLWRDPQGVPEGFDFVGATADALGYNVVQTFIKRPPSGESGYVGKIEVTVWRPPTRPINIATFGHGQKGANIFKTTEIAGMLAVIWQASDGSAGFGVDVRALDEKTGIEYGVTAIGLDVNGALEILRSLHRG